MQGQQRDAKHFQGLSLGHSQKACHSDHTSRQQIPPSITGPASFQAAEALSTHATVTLQLPQYQRLFFIVIGPIPHFYRFLIQHFGKSCSPCQPCSLVFDNSSSKSFSKFSDLVALLWFNYQILVAKVSTLRSDGSQVCMYNSNSFQSSSSWVLLVFKK